MELTRIIVLAPIQGATELLPVSSSAHVILAEKLMRLDPTTPWGRRNVLRNNYLWAEAGGLLTYGVSFPDLWRRAADKVALVLQGAKPSDLPVEQPSTVELVINLKTLKALGITLPPSIRVRIDRVIDP